MIRAFSSVGLWTLLSRLLGFLREALLSRAIGASGSPIADAFFTAFRIPNMFRRFLAEGAFNAGFVPMFAKRAGDPDEAREFAQNAFSGLATITLILVVIVQIFTPAFVMLLSAGFVGDERFAMAVNYTHITIFYILFMSLAALMSGVLNSLDRFALAAAAPVLLNVALIGALLLMLFVELDPYTRGIWLSWAVLIGGVFQFALLYYGMRRLGVTLILRLPRWNADMKALTFIILPAMLTRGVAQINLVVGSLIASFDKGGQSWMYYADRFYQLPVGLIGVAISVVLLPTMTKLIQVGDREAVRGRFNESLVFAMLLTLPAMAAFMSIPVPLVRTLFEGGKFLAVDTAATAEALRILALSLPAVIGQTILFPLFFAREDTRTPARFAVVSMLINVGVSFALMSRLGYLAPIWGTVISAWVLAIMLWAGARRFDRDTALLPATTKMLIIFAIASIGMAVFAFVLVELVPNEWWQSGLKWVAMILIVLIAGAAYFAVVMLAGGIRPSDLKKLASR